MMDLMYLVTAFLILTIIAVIVMSVKLMELHKTVQNLKEKSQAVENSHTTDLNSRVLTHPPNSTNQTTEDDGSFEEPTSNDTDAESYTTCTCISENNNQSPSKYTSFSDSIGIPHEIDQKNISTNLVSPCSFANLAEEELNKENMIAIPQDNADSPPLKIPLCRQTADTRNRNSDIKKRGSYSRNKRKQQKHTSIRKHMKSMHVLTNEFKSLSYRNVSGLLRVFNKHRHHPMYYQWLSHPFKHRPIRSVSRKPHNPFKIKPRISPQSPGPPHIAIQRLIANNSPVHCDPQIDTGPMTFIPRGKVTREEEKVIEENDVLEFPLLPSPISSESPCTYSNEPWETLPVQNTNPSLTEQLVQPTIKLGLRKQ
uniref:Uncharacterized protein n=1 Tax=Amphimedon queenslandica TaxID=400682 RepID=A0A1X7T3M6_AMPQE